MTRYRKLETATWTDRRFRELSAPPPNAQTLWIYLLTGQRTTLFPGLVLATESMIADDLRWPITGARASALHPPVSLREVWAEIAGQGMAVADWEHGVIVLPKALFDSAGRPRETARPGSTNQLRGWAKAWPEVPECAASAAYLLRLGEFAAAIDREHEERRRSPGRDTYRQAFEEAFAVALRKVDEFDPADLARTSTPPGGGPVPRPGGDEWGSEGGTHGGSQGGRVQEGRANPDSWGSDGGTSTPSEGGLAHARAHARTHTRASARAPAVLTPVPAPAPAPPGDRGYTHSAPGSGSGSDPPPPPEHPRPDRGGDRQHAPGPALADPEAELGARSSDSAAADAVIAELSRLQAEPAGPTRRVSIEVTDLGLACDSDELPAAARGLPGPSTPSGPPSAGSGSRSAEAPEVRARRRIGDRVWDRLNQIRAEIASERGWSDVQPLHPMDPGRVELACRLSESGAAGEAMARHVLAVAEAEARATGSVRYLSGSLFEARWWRDKLARRPADAGPPGSRAPAQAPAPAGARPHARVGAPARAQGLRAADMLDQQLAHVAELRARAAAPHPFDGGPADPACDLCGEGRAHPLHAGASAGEDPVTPC